MKNKKNIFITGLNSSITSNFLDLLNEELNSYKIYVSTTSKKKTMKDKNIHQILKVGKYYEDIKKHEKIIQKCDFFFHISYQNSEAFAENNPIEDYKINNCGLKNILDVVKKSKNITFVFISSVSLYKSSHAKVNENSEIKILSYYNLHKFYCENQIKINSNNSKINSIILRLSNVYGDKDIKKRDFVFKTIKNLKERKKITIFGTGNYYRDFININDVSRALVKIIKNKPKEKFNIFNLCSGKSITIKNLITLLTKELKKKRKSTILKMSLLRNKNELVKRNFYCSPSKFSRHFGWKPKINIANGLKKLIDDL